jgi:hypothetical protein
LQNLLHIHQLLHLQFHFQVFLRDHPPHPQLCFLKILRFLILQIFLILFLSLRTLIFHLNFVLFDCFHHLNYFLLDHFHFLFFL